MVAITGNVFRHLIGSDAFQEVDTVGIVEPIVKHAFFVDNADDITAVVHEAFALARSGRPGPVLIDITKNAQADEVKNARTKVKGKEIQKYLSDDSILDTVQAAVSSALRPIVIYGHGVTLGNAHAELEDFLEKSGIPAVWTFLGIGGVDETKPRRYGMLGMHGTMAANFAVHNADLIIGIGIRFDDRIYGKLTEFQKDKHIIHFDIDPSEFGKNVTNYASIVGNVQETLPLFTEVFSPQEEQQKDWDNWNTQIQGVDTENPLEKNDEGRFTQVSVIDMLYELKGE